jgi:acetyltransferase-like isoleucine patch superfamily enzyme
MDLIYRRNPVRIEDPLRVVSRIVNKLYSMWLHATYPFAPGGRKWSIHYTCGLRRTTAHRIKLGNHVLILKDAYLDVIARPEESGEPVIVIDDNCWIARRSTISAKNCIHLEQDVILSPSVLIMDHSHAYENTALPIKEQGVTEGGRIRIGQGCWIGHGAAIVCTQGELVLGRNCVVAANAVVTRSFPPYSVISGNPARVVKQFDPEKNTWVLGASRSPEFEHAIKHPLIR